MIEPDTKYIITKTPKNEDKSIPKIIGIFQDYTKAHYFLKDLTGSANYESEEYEYNIDPITTDF